MLPYKLVYHPGYDLNLGPHVFPSQKFRMVRDTLVGEDIADPTDIVQPEPASDEDVLRVHTAEYVHKLQHDGLSATEKMVLEIPYSEQTVRAFWLAAGGSILAATFALLDGFAANIGGGFHHAFPGHGEGFCMLHDVAIAIRRLQADGAIRTAMVVDTDVHHGNGTAAIFAQDDSVFTLSIHQHDNYPMRKPPSNLDINLDNGVMDDEYLEKLGAGLEESLAGFAPDLLFYIAGADPYRDDQLGGLWVSMAGLRKRDELVFAAARQRKIPVAIALAGGYACDVKDTVRIHVNTMLAARDVSDRTSPQPR